MYNSFTIINNNKTNTIACVYINQQTLFLIFSSKFSFHFVDFALLAVVVGVLHHLRLLVVQHHQVASTDVKTRQMIYGILSIINIFVNYKCGASGVLFVAPGIRKRSKLVETHK